MSAYDNTNHNNLMYFTNNFYFYKVMNIAPVDSHKIFLITSVHSLNRGWCMLKVHRTHFF